MIDDPARTVSIGVGEHIRPLDILRALDARGVEVSDLLRAGRRWMTCSSH
jgi:hypothetical protein